MTARLIASLLAIATSLAATAYADSPLTSTPFHTAYGDHPIVAHARGIEAIDAVTMHRLRDPAVPHDIRAATVNALGWRNYGPGQSPRENARTFLRYVANAHGVPQSQLRVENLTTEELLALGYLAAMDRYRDLTPIGGSGPVEQAEPSALLEAAHRRAPTDRAIATVRALVLAQAELERRDLSSGDRVERGFCRVWQAYERAGGPRAAEELRAPAREIVQSYMRAYRGSCRG